MNHSELVRLSVGWQRSEKDEGFRRYNDALAEFARSCSEREFQRFLIGAKRKGKLGRSDIQFVIHPAMELFLKRFSQTPGRLLAACIEATFAGAEEESVAHLRPLVSTGYANPLFDLLLLLRPGFGQEVFGGGFEWEIGLLRKLLADAPRRKIYRQALETLEGSGKSIKHRTNEALWNKLYWLLQRDYEKSFPELIR